MDAHFGYRAISADTALCIARYIGTTSEFWVDLQARYDLDVAKKTAQRRIEEAVASSPPARSILSVDLVA